MPFVPRTNFEIHYGDRGPQDAPAVVLLPSFLCDATMFTHMAETLAPRYRVLSVDLRGHGRSGTPPRDYTLEEQAEDIVAVLDHAKVERAALVGLSQGGMTALRVALAPAARVRALVLMDSSAGPESRSVAIRYELLATVFRWAGLLGFVERDVRRKMFSESFLSAHPEVVARHVVAWRSLDRLGVVRSIRAIARRTDLLERIGGIDLPTLVVCGRDDAALPLANSEQLATRIPGARLVVIPNTGHLSTIEKPEETTAAVAGFLDEVLVRSARP